MAMVVKTEDKTVNLGQEIVKAWGEMQFKVLLYNFL